MPLQHQKNNASVPPAVTSTAWPRQMVRAGLSVGTSCQTRSSGGGGAAGADRQHWRSRGKPEQRPAPVWGQLPELESGTDGKMKISFWISCMQEHAQRPDVATHLRMFVMKMLKSFLINCLWYLLPSAVGWCRIGFSCCPTFPDSLSFPFTFFPSLTWVISFCTPTSLPPLYLPSSINLQSFLPSQLFFFNIHSILAPSI